MTATERIVAHDGHMGFWYTGEEIVRCHDCKHMETRGIRRYCNAHAGGYPEVMPNDFCSWGEREES